MSHFSRALLVVGSSLGVVTGCHAHLSSAASALTAPVETELCSLVRNPAAFAGKEVAVAGEAVTDTRHFVLLVDSQCPGQAVALRFPKEPPENHDLSSLREALFAGRRDQRPIRGRFVGTFEWHPDDIPSRVLLYRSHKSLSGLPATGRVPGGM
jgi:hypothetical protein